MESLPPELEQVHAYYSAKVREHGASARGVDWSSEESQQARFRELVKVVSSDGEPTVLDFGCGYGALLAYLRAEGWGGRYVGYDFSAEMIDAAHSLHRGDGDFTTVQPEGLVFDYVVASGVFNVRIATPDDRWRSYIDSTLEEMNRLSRAGFAFNMLTAYADADRMRPDLFYANPSAYFDLCVARYSRHVALLHDYLLYEFTILVRK